MAISIIKNGGIIIFPTDTVYGVGCDPFNKKAVEKIYKIKNRDPEKLFPVLGFSIEDLEKIAYFSNIEKKIAKEFWPGPVTLILKLKDEKLKISMNLADKVAVRVPKNNCLLSVLKKCKLLIGTSANPAGEKSYRDPKDCIENLKNFDLCLDGGKIVNAGESTILEICNGTIIIHRSGQISKEEILKKFEPNCNLS